MSRLGLLFLSVLWLLAIGLITWIHMNERWGSGMRLTVTAAILFVNGFFSLLWFAFCAPIRRNLRLGITAAILGICLLSALLFRLEEVTGGMRPRFVLRWSRPADERLESIPHRPDDVDAQIDLQATGPDDYPRFLGTDQRQSIDGVQFETNWTVTPPRCVWKQGIGAGWSAFAAVNGYAVTQEQRGDQELVSCYEIASGALSWTHAIPTRHETKLGGAGPRATPCIDQGRVYALGATGVLRCLDGANGTLLWRQDLLQGAPPAEDLRGIAWGRAGSPLIVDQLVVVPVGGPVDGPQTSLVAYDKVTGREVWRAGKHQISYASPVRTDLLGQDQILVVLQDFVASFDSQTGAPLWEHPWPGPSNSAANVSNAVPVGQDQVFLSKGYGQGAELLQLSIDDNRWHASNLWKKPVIMKTKLSNVVPHEGYIYGLDDTILECIEIPTGRKCWKRGRFGYGQLIRAGEVLIVISEEGELATIAANPKKYIEYGRFQAIEGKCWNHLCLYGPYLLVRNATEAACYELPNWQRNEQRSESAESVSGARTQN